MAETIRLQHQGMRRTTTRDRAAAGLYAIFGGATLIAGVALASMVLLVVGAASLVVAFFALRSFPIDRGW